MSPKQVLNTDFYELIVRKLEKIIIVLNCYNNKNSAQFWCQQAFVSPKTFIFFTNLKVGKNVLKHNFN